MQVAIDRFEGKYAVCEKDDRTMINVEIKDIPKGAKEGDVLNIEGSSITIDAKETSRRKAEIEELSRNLWK